MKLVKLRIPTGRKYVGFCRVRHQTKSVALLDIDMKLKRAVVDGHGSAGSAPEIMLSAGEDSYFRGRRCVVGVDIWIGLPAYKGWTVYSVARTGKYVVSVVLISKAVAAR